MLTHSNKDKNIDKNRDKHDFPEEKESSIRPTSGDQALATSWKGEPQTCFLRQHEGQSTQHAMGFNRWPRAMTHPELERATLARQPASRKMPPLWLETEWGRQMDLPCLQVSGLGV